MITRHALWTGTLAFLSLIGVGAAQDQGGAAVLAAVRDGDAARLAGLLAAGASPEVRDSAYLDATALMIAAERDDSTSGRLLLDAGADPDAVDRAGDTALNWAAYYGHVATVRMLLDAGADPAITGHGNALEIALRRGHEEILAPLAERLGTRQPIPAEAFAVLDAVRSGDEARLRAALTADGSAEARDAYGRPALQLAAASGHATMVAILLGAGATVDATDPIGFTPLMAAARGAHTNVAVSLLEAGANARHRAMPRGLGLTPLHLAAIGGDGALADVLLAAGADIDAAGTAGNTPALWALSEGQLDLVAALLSRGADPDLANRDGDTIRSMARAWSIGPVLAALGETPPDR